MNGIGSDSRTAEIGDVRLTLYRHHPARSPQGVMLMFHGNSGNAEALRDFAIPLSERLGLIVVAPLFDRKRFPPVAYQRGHVTDGRGRPRDPTGWTTRLVPALLDWAQQGRGLPYWLWGFSAGAQFLSRVAAFQPLPREPERYVIVSPSVHVQPLIGRWPQGEAAPYGLGGLFETEEERQVQRRYLGRPLTLCVGAEDDEATDPTLGRNRAARRQGPDRLSRAARTFDLGAMTALRLGCDFGWQLKIVPGIGHSARDMLEPLTAMSVMGLLPDIRPKEESPSGQLPFELPPQRKPGPKVRIAGRWFDLPRKT
jgi:hypothetical protein